MTRHDNSRCCNVDCPEDAAVAVWWPSPDGPKPMCASHARAAGVLAQVMGFQLAVTPLAPLLVAQAAEVRRRLAGDGCEACYHLKVVACGGCGRGTKPAGHKSLF